MKLNSFKLLLAAAFLGLAVAPVAYSAAEKEPNLDANVDVSDKVSLARGAKYYANFCMGCHSTSVAWHLWMKRLFWLLRRLCQNISAPYTVNT